MASNHVRPHSQSQPPSVTLSLPGRRPPHYRINSGLRSAEEQLRDIREGNTSWQLSSPYASTCPSPEPTPNGDARGETSGAREVVGTGEAKVRVYLHHIRKTDTLPLILLTYEIS